MQEYLIKSISGGLPPEILLINYSRDDLKVLNEWGFKK